MKTNAITAVVAFIGSMAVGAVVFLAMGRNTHIYYRFVGLVGVVLAIVLAVMAYRKYFGHSEPVVEETPAAEGGATR